MDPRVVKPKLPLRVIISAVGIGLAVFAFIAFAVWQSGLGLKEARKTGVIVKKEYIPGPAEKQITLGRDRSLQTLDKKGQYLLRVDVPNSDGTVEPYDVEIFDQQQFDKLQVGDQFDVGPYLQP